MNTFQKEISFLSKQAISKEDGSMEWEMASVTKTALFKELDKTDRDQHKLHFKLTSITGMLDIKKDEERDPNTLKIDSDVLYDITVKAFKTLVVVDKDSITVEERTEFLNDSSAIFEFGMWFFSNKFLPFFQTFKLNLK